MSSRALRRVTTATSVILLLLVTTALAAADRWWPASDAAAVAAAEVQVPAGRTELVCPGPARVPVEDAGLDYDPAFDPAPQGSRTTVTSFSIGRPGETAPAGGYRSGLAGSPESTIEPFTPPRTLAGSARAASAQGPGLVTGETASNESALVAGTTVVRTARGDLRGLAAQRCAEAATASAWLVAGSTQVGSSSRLVLANPGDTPATVRLTAWGAAGPLELGQLASVLVPAGSERSVLLESVVPDEPRLAVHLTVTGGRVAASVQDSALRGFVPAGVDLVAPTVAPAPRVLVPGLILVETDIDDPDAALLRILNPGTEATDVRLRLLGADGEMTVPGAETRVVEAGTVTDVSLAGVPAGAYTAELVSDQPVTAAGMLVRVGDRSADDPDQRVLDRAWLPAAAGVTTSLVPVPPNATGVGRIRVVVANPDNEAVTLEVRAATVGGGVRVLAPVPLPARSTVVLERETFPDAVGLELIALPDGAGGDAADETAALDPTGGTAGMAYVAGVVLVGEAPDGPLIAGVSVQPDLESARTVAVRLPFR